MTTPPDKTRPAPTRRGYAPLKATRPAANGAKTSIPTSAPEADKPPRATAPAARAAITPTDISQPARDPADADLAGMQTRFASDFANGLIGRQHNTYQHRSRVLRRLAEDGAAI